jgi:hypothetical protein
MNIIRPTSGKDMRLWTWSEFSTFTKSITLAIPLLLIVLVLFVMPFLRHTTGAYIEIDGTVQAVGNYETGGSGLHGRMGIIASVTLSDGKVVQAGVRDGLQITPGSKVTVREFPQNIGQPAYDIFSVSQQAR